MLAATASDSRSIPELLASEATSFSFEFFPAKDDVAEVALWQAVRDLERLRPAFVSVTYGAGGSTQDRTVRVTERIARDTTLLPLAHLTCVNATLEQLRQIIGQYAAAGVRHILALRGDPPGNVGGRWIPHPEGLDHADELVSLIRSLGSFEVGVAAFPDGHPESASLADDVDVLVRKADAGATFAITQMVFDAEKYLRLRDAVAAHRPLPITPGLMPVTNFAQIARMTQLMGTPLPSAVLSRLEPLQHDRQALRAEGVAIATELAQRMLAEGAPGLHFITMNRSTATVEVHAQLDRTAGQPGYGAGGSVGGRPVRAV